MNDSYSCRLQLGKSGIQSRLSPGIDGTESIDLKSEATAKSCSKSMWSKTCSKDIGTAHDLRMSTDVPMVVVTLATTDYPGMEAQSISLYQLQPSHGPWRLTAVG